jgi:acetate kinase
LNLLVVKAKNSVLEFKLFNEYEFILGGEFTNLDNKKFFFEDVAIGKKLEIEEDEYYDAVSYIKNWIDEEGKIDAVVFKIPHGVDKFINPIEITNENFKELRQISEFDIFGNTFVVEIIKDFQKIFPYNKLMAVFDTEAFANMPQYASRFNLPNSIQKDYAIRKYGSDGLKHEAMIQISGELIGTTPHPNPAFDRSEIVNEVKFITVVLEDNVSISAVKDGVIVDTSGGFSVNSSLITPNSTQYIDSSVLYYLTKHLALTNDQIEKIFLKNSGISGLETKGNRLDEILELAKSDNKKNIKSLEYIVYTIQKSIGEMLSVLNGAEVISFSGKYAKDPIVRELLCDNLNNLGIDVDSAVNSEVTDILQPLEFGKSAIRLFAFDINEDRIIIEKAKKLLLSNKN